MRRFHYTEPDDNFLPVHIIVTEDYIIKNYFPYWSNAMTDKGKSKDINNRNCIDDYCIIHWAEEITPEEIYILTSDENNAIMNLG